MALDSRFAEIAGHRVHYWEGGSGFPVLMLHGVGPGTSIEGNFAPVLEPMAARYHVVAADLIGFGESQRKHEEPYFDVALWVRQGVEMLGLLGGDGPCGVAGHSLGGALALKVASRSDRVSHVLTSGTIGAPYRLNAALDGFWSLPRDRDALRAAMAAMVFDAGDVSDEMIEGRWALLDRDGYGDYFRAMFAGDRQRFIDAAILSDAECASIAARVTMIHGRNDRPCPAAETTLVLAGRLADADVHLIGRCGHNLPRERPAAYLAAAAALFG